MTNVDRIRAARAMLRAVTPLSGDCGRRCGGACCKPDEAGNGGMLLFPGEAALYRPAPPWARLEASDVAVMDRPLVMLTCQGECPRDERPLACRIFPLTPLVDARGEVRVALDVRAWPICPLMAHGMGLSRAFAAACLDAMRLVCQDAEALAYARVLTRLQDAYRMV